MSEANSFLLVGAYVICGAGMALILKEHPDFDPANSGRAIKGLTALLLIVFWPVTVLMWGLWRLSDIKIR